MASSRKQKTDSIGHTKKTQVNRLSGESRRAPTLIFTITGPPVGKQRTRSAVHSARHVTPKKTRDYEHRVAQRAIIALAHLTSEEANNWLATTKQVFLDLKIYHANGHKPDSDNVVKAIEDGCTGVLWRDDRHVLPRVQWESWPDDNPRVEVRVTPTGYEVTK
jgi:Holliday junction resolvase RusA-like endonuclease